MLMPALSGLNYAARVSYDPTTGNQAVTDDNNGNVVLVTGGGNTTSNCGGSCWSITNDGKYFYWSDYSGASRIPTGGGAVTTVWSASPPVPHGVAIDPGTGRLWVIDQGTGGDIASCASVTNCTMPSLVTNASGDEFTVDGSNLYFWYNSGIYKCALGTTCGTNPTFVTSAAYVADMKNDASFVYWITSAGAVWKVAK
jgi:hypothetical protein